MKDSRRPLEVHETRALLERRMAMKTPHIDQYTPDERREALAHTPMGTRPEDYIETYLLGRQPIRNQRD